MAKIKFGTSQVNNPTPSKINLWVRVFTVASGVFMGWMSTNNLIHPVTQSYISSVLGLGIGLCNGVAPLFGVQVNSDTVPKDDVKSMDSN
jgi:hypothetical protein